MSTTETTARTVKVTICGPNLPGDASGTFHVHKAGCADLTRSPMYRRIDPPWSMDATSEREVVEAVYSDIIDENPDYGWTSYHHDFKFFPCVGGLPVDDEPTPEEAAARQDFEELLEDGGLAESTAKEDARNRQPSPGIVEDGAGLVNLLIAGERDEDERREAVAWLLGNVSRDPALADRIAQAAGLLES